ncbi:MAG TPA: selenide, water dikinase SelD, partial [Candidatus Hydrogenedentes bacterium]|nr:selenide, water dikinase SelD [Candidatus Hydrogenedentota bacterium]
MAIDIERRRAVMARSRKLGHCVCNPRHPCPCPTFLEENVCPCAGERPPARSKEAVLTRHVRKAGCASKIGQADLLRVLSKLPPVTDPNVLVGAAAGDDAGIYRLDAAHALVQTVDVFTPCVDDPYLFGQIAAANAVSDVYAMGGRPVTALSIVGFPIEILDDTILEAILLGGMDKLSEADCA